MKLNSGFLTHDDGDTKILVSTGATKFSGLVRTNGTAGFIVGCLETETSEDEIVEKILDRWEVDEETARKEVRKLLDQLREIGAIDD